MDKEKQEHKLSLSLFREMLKNSVKLTAMLWREKRGEIILLGLVFLVVSAAPFLQSGSRGLLINELVKIAGSGTTSSYLLLLVGVLILATLIPSILFTIQNYLSKLFWFFLDEKIETLIIKKKGELDVATHENPEHKDLFNRVSEEGIWRVRNFIDRQFYMVISAFRNHKGVKYPYGYWTKERFQLCGQLFEGGGYPFFRTPLGQV